MRSLLTLPFRASLVRGFAVAAVALSTSACLKADPTEMAAAWRDDYKDRHPIVVADREETLDVFFGENGGKLDRRQEGDVVAFAKAYAAHGKGPMTAFVPSHGRGAGVGVAAIRHALGAAGGGGGLIVRNYQAPSGGAHPIRLVYTRLQATVATRCGQFPHDVTDISEGTRSWKNRDYYDFGCSYQHNLAQQIADPLDIVRGRPEGRVDTQRRIEVFEKGRKGEDPSTNWRQKATAINTTLGGN